MRNVWNLIARNRNYRLLLGANLVSAAGDWIMNIGMTFYVYLITGSVLASGAMFLVVILPQMLFGSLGGVYADRWNRQRTMIVTNLLLAMTLIPLFVMDGRSQIWILYAVVFAQGLLEQLFAPAEAATVPHVVPAEDLVAANALNGQNRELTRLLGAALGGILAATGGIGLVAVVDLVSYLVAASLLAMMRIPAQASTPEPTDAEGDTAQKSRVRHEWMDGIRLCLRRRDLSTLFLFRAMNGFGEGIFAVLLAPFLIGVLHANGGEFGAISAVQAIGGIVGGFAVASMSRRLTSRQLLGYGAFLFGVFDLIIAIYPLALPMLWPVFGLMIVVGLPGAAQSAGFATLQQERTPDAYRGRIFGAINTGSATAMVVGIVLASALGGVLGIIAILSLQGLIHMVAGPFVLARLGRSATSEVQQQVRPAVLAGDGQ
jgi:MFS family permease